ncbi:MAG: hypothetical protein BMS9Abin37_2742 [Acidobacteriota bacterium]|nr:MAG: hypothetical protein BMS9Abin37_2742 [Acidobacteriota bacterium]
MRTIQILALSSSIAALGLSCTGQPGERALTTFGNAVQAGDETTAAQVSLVEFPGEVSTWEIIEIGPESSEPFPLIKLIEERKAMEKELEAMVETTNAFLQENEELFYKYKPRKDKDPETKFTGKLKEFDEEFSALMKEQTDQDDKIRDAGKAIDALKKAAALSTNTPGLSTSYDGDVLERTAKVKFDDKDYSVTLKLYALVNTEHNMTPMTRWIITDIRE